MSNSGHKMDEQMSGGCLALVVGGIVFGAMGLGIGLLFLSPFQAIGLGLLSSVVGGGSAAILGYRACK